MSRNSTPHFRRQFAFLALALALAFGGCGGGEVQLPVPAGEDPVPGPELVFSMPQEGATVSESVTVSVTGDDVTKVTFSLDGVEQSADAEAPFEWVLDPDLHENGEHVLAVSADTVDGTESASVRITLADLPSGPGQPADIFEAVQNLQPGHWLEIPNTALEAVKPNPLPAGSLSGITKAWCGGAFDTKRDRLIIWGGGHGDYSGNEVYAFDLGTLQWKRLTDPSAFPEDDPTNSAMANYHPDGRPVTRHTYAYVAYIPPPVDRFFSGGGAGLWKSGQWEDTNTWLFDFDQNEWSRKSTCPVEGIGAVCAVDGNGIVWQHRKGLASYNASTDTWTQHTASGDVRSYDLNAEVDTVNNRLLIIGAGQTFAYDLDAETISGKVLATSGDKAIESTGDPRPAGLAFHAPSKRLVGWKGGSDVYTLDVNTLVWKRIAAKSSVSPGDALVNGTYGRFRYSPKQNLFIVYNRVQENVFVYRLPDP